MMKMENNTQPISPPEIQIQIQIPVTFYDGEIELDMGTIQINPSLTFKQFQSLISQKLHISPHQITIYFQNHNNINPPHGGHVNHHRRRHPVTSKFDFGSVCLNANMVSNMLFWVVQKRSRRTRRRRNHANSQSNNNMVGCPVSFSLLRRSEFANNEYDQYKMRMLEIEKERYLMSMSLNSNVYNDLSFGGYFNGGHGGGGYNCNFSDDGGSSSTSSVGFCDVCFSCRGETVPFHWCKNDVVTKVFRSPAGPIAPPSKKFDFLG